MLYFKVRVFLFVLVVGVFFVSGSVLAQQPTSYRGIASWYSHKQCNCAASTIYPKGTKLRVVNQHTKKFVDVVVNDYGPDRKKHPDRIIDLDLMAFKKIGSPRLGLIPVTVALVSRVDDGAIK